MDRVLVSTNGFQKRVAQVQVVEMVLRIAPSRHQERVLLVVVLEGGQSTLLKSRGLISVREMRERSH